MEVDDTSSEGPPQGDCEVDIIDAVGTSLGDGLIVEHVEDTCSLEVKFKTFCAAFRPW